MSRPFVIASPTLISEDPSIDWQKCIFCQEITTELLQCPAKSKRGDIGKGYYSVAENILSFQKLDVPVTVTKLDDGSGIVETLTKYSAKWHKRCRLKINNTELRRAEKRKSNLTSDEPGSTSAKKFTRGCQRNSYNVHDKNICFFCEDGENTDKLHDASTFRIDQHVRDCAVKLCDERLLAKLSFGDLVAQDAKYHSKCLAALYNKSRGINTQDSTSNSNQCHGIALAELVSYVEECKGSDSAPVFRMTDLYKLYCDRLSSLGTPTTNVHSTRLKDRLLQHVPDLQVYKGGRENLLIFSNDVGPAIRRALEEDFDLEGYHLLKASHIVRRDTMDIQSEFHGSFEKNCQKLSVPTSLLSLVSMLLEGPNINKKSYSQETLSIAQLIRFNMHHKTTDAISTRRHAKSHETPLCIYTGVSIHAQTRKRDLVDTFFKLGLSISYDRVLSISTELGDSVCQQYESEGAVIPSKLREGLFTMAAVDNIDHNPTSTTSSNSFHGTGISLFQHPTNDYPGLVRCNTTVNNDTTEKHTKAVRPLPLSYSCIPPASLHCKEPKIPDINTQLETDSASLYPMYLDEGRWLSHIQTCIENDTPPDENNVTWSSYHADVQIDCPTSPAISTLLPLFDEQAKSTAMIKHAMNVILQSTNKVNPGQIPVITFDQPLYALAKTIQWNWPDTHGEQYFVIMFGGLHIELAALKTIGDWLDGSGWVSALTSANVAASGTANSFLKASHIAKTRYAHQVTAASLHILQRKGFEQYLSQSENENVIFDFTDWKQHQAEVSPQFKYWSLTLDFELTILLFVRAIRERNFRLYVDILKKIIPWFFALNHTHYARWLPVHLRDMESLKEMHPKIAGEFHNGLFTVAKSCRSFSAIAIDHAHEQNNAIVKSTGGAVGLTENPDALRRWMVAGPELARLVGEFESNINTFPLSVNAECHHEQQHSCQNRFLKDVQSLVGVFQDLGNPFLEENNELIVLDTKEIANEIMEKTVNEIENLGKKQFECYVEERLNTKNTSIYVPIKKNKLTLFSSTRETSQTGTGKIEMLKNNCSLFSRLYISCQNRNGNLEEFFKYENQSSPPSLSVNGNLRHTTKSDIIKCLESMVPQVKTKPNADGVIFDGAAVVNYLRPGTSKTFHTYANNVFIPHILQQGGKEATRVDVVFDRYLPDSLKASTRQERGIGIRRRVNGASDLPRNWSNFLRNDFNKTELFQYLASQISLTTHQVKLTSTVGEAVTTNSHDTEIIANLSSCNHEEADTRIFLHVLDMYTSGIKRVIIRTVDSDVVVLAIASYYDIVTAEDLQLWIAFGVGQNFKYIPIHNIVKSMGKEKAIALAMFHAFTGCDTVSSFNGRGKKSAWDTWTALPELTSSLLTLSKCPDISTVNTIMPVLERFVVLMYNKTSELVSVNDARKDLFTHKSRTMEMLPPTRAALIEHSKRAVLQGGYVWNQCLVLIQKLPSPSEWGWEKDKDQWKPTWSKLAAASESCQELIKCGCKKGCRSSCKCAKAALKCTALCLCAGDCERDN